MKFLKLIALLALLPLAFGTSAHADAINKGKENTYVTNLGRVVLSQADLIVSGSISQNTTSSGALSTRSFLISSVLWGKCEQENITVLYSDPTSFDKDDLRLALALTRVDGSKTHYKLFGQKLSLDDDESSLDAIKDYLSIERSAKDEQAKIALLLETLDKHLKSTSSTARIASVELLYAVRHYPRSFTHERYLTYAKHAGSLKETRTSVSIDLNLALRGMVSEHLKTEAMLGLLRAEDVKAADEALEHLELYFASFPEAFGLNDAERAITIAERIDGTRGTQLKALAQRIKQSADEFEKQRKSDDEEKNETGNTPDDTEEQEVKPTSPFVAPKDK